MTNYGIEFSRKSGKILHGGMITVQYRTETPSVMREGFPNSLFSDVTENYIKYLESFSARRLVPEYEKMKASGARARDVKKALGIPLDAFLTWRAEIIESRFLSLRCETRLTLSEAEKIFTLKTITIDLENMTVMRVSDFSKRRRKNRYAFFFKNKKLYIFKKERVFADSGASAEQKRGVRLCNMNNKRYQNL